MPTDPTPAAPWTTWVLRVTSTLALLATLAQGLLAGLLTTGEVDLLTVHSNVGTALSLVALVQLVAAVLERRSRGRAGQNAGWRMPILSGLFLAIVLGQIPLGFARVVAPHIFLGVTSAALAMLVLLVVVTASSPARADQPSATEAR